MHFFLSKNFRRITNLYNTLIAKELPDDLNLENYGEIILLLSTLDQPLTQSHLAERLYLDKSRVAVLVDHLVAQQYVFSERNLADKREYYLYLTGKGEEVAPLVSQVVNKVNVMMHRELDKTFLNHFYLVLQQIEKNLTSNLY